MIPCISTAKLRKLVRMDRITQSNKPSTVFQSLLQGANSIATQARTILPSFSGSSPSSSSSSSSSSLSRKTSRKFADENFQIIRLEKNHLNWNENNNAFVAKDKFSVASFNLLAPCYKRLAENPSGGKRLRESTDETQWIKRVEQTGDFCKSQIYSGDYTMDIIGFQVQCCLFFAFCLLLRDDIGGDCGCDLTTCP